MIAIAPVPAPDTRYNSSLSDVQRALLIEGSKPAAYELLDLGKILVYARPQIDGEPEPLDGAVRLRRQESAQAVPVQGVDDAPDQADVARHAANRRHLPVQRRQERSHPREACAVLHGEAQGEVLERGAVAQGDALGEDDS